MFLCVRSEGFQFFCRRKARPYDWEGFFGDDFKDEAEYNEALKKAMLVDLMAQAIGDVPLSHIRNWCHKKKIDLQKEEEKYLKELYN